jgi:hypothetical protein
LKIGEEEGSGGGDEVGLDGDPSLPIGGSLDDHDLAGSCAGIETKVVGTETEGAVIN